MTSRVMHLKDVAEKLGVSKATIYALIRTGVLPPGFLLGASSRGWRESDIEAWIDLRAEAPKFADASHRTAAASKARSTARTTDLPTDNQIALDYQSRCVAAEGLSRP